jgi:hypothetical protein
LRGRLENGPGSDLAVKLAEWTAPNWSRGFRKPNATWNAESIFFAASILACTPGPRFTKGIRAGGALAAFLVVYFFSPAVFPT